MWIWTTGSKWSQQDINSIISEAKKHLNASATKSHLVFVSLLETKEPFLQKLPCLGRPARCVSPKTSFLRLNSRASFNLMISSSDLMRGNEFYNSLTTRYARVRFSTPLTKTPLINPGESLEVPLETSFDENFRHFSARQPSEATSEIYFFLLQSISLFSKTFLGCYKKDAFSVCAYCNQFGATNSSVSPTWDLGQNIPRCLRESQSKARPQRGSTLLETL